MIKSSSKYTNTPRGFVATVYSRLVGVGLLYSVELTALIDSIYLDGIEQRRW